MTGSAKPSRASRRTLGCFVASLLAITLLPPMVPEILRPAAPGLLGALAVMHRQALLVGKAVLGVIAINLKRLAGRLHGLLEGVDRSWRAPVVLVCEMRLQRDSDVGRLRRLLWGNAVEHDARGELGNFRSPDDRHGAAQAETGEPDPRAVAPKVLCGAAHGLRGQVHEIERVHLFARRVGVMIGHHLALVEIGRQRIKTRARKTIAHALDLVLQSPPFLDPHDAGRVATGCVGEIAGRFLAVRTLEIDDGAHGVLRRFSWVVAAILAATQAGSNHMTAAKSPPRGGFFMSLPLPSSVRVGPDLL